MFCSECGRPTEATNKFCPTCGHKAVEKGEVSSKKDGKKDIKCLTFEQFAAKKRQERSTHFRTSSKTKKKSKDTEPFALINIGLMKYISADTTTPVRGKSLPLKVKKDAPYAEVFTMALTKREAYDKSFDTKLSWNLVYPDGQPCSTLPGQEEEFTLRKYKEDLGKPYNRITLYLCPDEPDNMNSEDIGSDDHHQYDRDQNVRKKEQKENDTAGYIGPQNSDDGKCPIEIDSDSERQLDRINSSNSVPPSYGATQQHDKSSSSNNNIVQSNEIDASSSDTMMLLTANDDLLYASLLFDENMHWSDSESEYLQDPAVPLEITDDDKSLQDILSNLNTQINSNEISKFNISRSHIWEGAVRGLSRKTFSPANKVSVKFTDDVGNAEGAVDSGGPMREFFTLIIEWMLCSQLFCGSERGKCLSINSNYLNNDFYFHAGQLIAMSVVHGGPGPRCFSQSLYDALTIGVQRASVDVEDVYDFELQGSLKSFVSSPTVEEAQTVISNSNLETIFDLAGTLEVLKTKEDVFNVAKKTAHWFVLERVQASLERFKAGLSVLGVFDAMCMHYTQFKSVFCYSSTEFSADTFGSIFSVLRSEEGSNKSALEGLVLSHWNDFLQDVEEKVVGGLDFPDILFFACGCKELPPLGLSLELCFLHAPEKDGLLSKFPKANTCSCELHLPVVHSTYDDFKKDLTLAFLNTKGFGYA